MVSDFQKNWTTRDKKHYNNGTNLEEIWQATALLNVDNDDSNSFWNWWF